MNRTLSIAPVKIIVRSRTVKLARQPRPTTLKFARGEAPAAEFAPPALSAPKPRERFEAHFEGGPHHGLFVTGCLSPDEAVGALIREAAHCYETVGEVLDFVASLFGVDPARTSGEHLARNVRFANRTKKRVHPGVRIEFDLAPPTLPKLTAAVPTSSACAVKGGA